MIISICEEYTMGAYLAERGYRVHRRQQSRHGAQSPDTWTRFHEDVACAQPK